MRRSGCSAVIPGMSQAALRVLHTAGCSSAATSRACGQGCVMEITHGLQNPGWFCPLCQYYVTRPEQWDKRILIFFPHHTAVVKFFIITSNQGDVMPHSTCHGPKISWLAPLSSQRNIVFCYLSFNFAGSDPNISLVWLYEFRWGCSLMWQSDRNRLKGGGDLIAMVQALSW